MSKLYHKVPGDNSRAGEQYRKAAGRQTRQKLMSLRALEASKKDGDSLPWQTRIKLVIYDFLKTIPPIRLQKTQFELGDYYYFHVIKNVGWARQ